MIKKRRRRTYKFTEKKHSKMAIAALLLAIASVVLFCAVAYNSYSHGGHGSMYLGSAGVASMLVAMVSFVMALNSLKDENSFKFFPYLSTVVTFAAMGGWIALYVVGSYG
jgi:hypothetical protein